MRLNIFSGRAKWFSLLFILGFLAISYEGLSSLVYASSDTHGSQDHSGGDEHRADAGHSAGEEAHHGGDQHGGEHHGESLHGGGHHDGGGHHKGTEHGEEVDSVLPFLVVMVPFASVFLLIISKEKGSLNLAAYSTAACFFVNMLMTPAIWRGDVLNFVLDLGVYKMSIAFFADSLSFLAGTISSFVWMIVSIYSIEYMGHEHNVKRYNIFSILSFTGMMGVVYTRNLFTLYIFFEMLSICSYVMVVHEETDEATEAGFKYLGMGITGGLILFMGIVMTYHVAGTADLAEISKMGVGLKDNPWMPFIFVAMMIGFAVKSGLFPVHIWLPSAHPVAPAPASALLSGVMIKAGGYGIIRTIYSIVGMDVMRNHTLLIIVLFLAAINIFLGSAMAIRSTEIKQLLAYSSIAQIGYVILGAALLTPSALIGGVVHIFNHAIIKGTLFMCAGAFIHQTGLRQLEDLRGIGRKMPIVTICFTMAAFSMIGFPPFNGFISKWFLAIGALEVAEAGSYAFSTGVMAFLLLLLSSFMNLMYYGPILYGAWFKKRAGEETVEVVKNVDPGKTMWVPLLILAICTAIFGIFPHFPIHFAHHFSQMTFY